jgi:hypothetical protein
MSTPFDKVIEHIAATGYHNHRLEEHSDIVSNGVFNDLIKKCAPIRNDVKKGIIRAWLNVRAPGARERKIDLFVGEPEKGLKKPNIKRLRICAENKSVITAHRNRDARFDDLNETMKVVHAVKQEAVIVATILVGVAPNVLNIPDQVKKHYKNKPIEFEKSVLPRLSSGDQSLWDEFAWAVSLNKESDCARTIEKFRMLRTRPPGHTHVQGYDYILIVPVHIDNVNPPRIAVQNSLGINVNADYKQMVSTICKAYTARWHL